MTIFQCGFPIKSLRWLIIFSLVALLVPAQSFAKKKSKKQSEWSQPIQEISALISSGQFSEALKLVQTSKIKKAKGPIKNRLLFMSAYLNYLEGKYDKAANLFDSIRGNYPLLEDYVQYYLALSLRESGKPQKAIEILRSLKTETKSPHLKILIDRELALAYCKTSDRATAIDLLNGLIQSEKSDIQAYHLRFDRAQCLRTLGYPGEALVSLKSLYLSYPEGDLSEKIRIAIENLGAGPGLGIADHIQRGQQLMENKRPALAVLDFEAAVEGYGPAHAPGSLKKQLAEAYFKARNYPQAAQAFEDLQNHYPGSFGPKEELRLAQSYSRSDQFNKAIEAYQGMLAIGKRAGKPDLQYKIAFLYMDKGDLKKSNRLFTEFLEIYPKHRRRSQIYWFLAWNHYLLEDYKQAQVYLDILEMEFPRSRYAKRVPYWRARILEKQGNKQGARLAYQNIAEQDPFSYYGFLSLKRLENDWDPTNPPKKSWAQDLPRYSVPAPFSLNAPNPGGKGAVNRLRELLLLGLWEDFLGELDFVTAQEGIGGDLRDLKSGVAGTAGGPPFYAEGGWATSYPPAYATLVALFSNSRNFPLPLTWAIMREESRFRPDVVSPAQAIGLMQIIPPTGTEIAQSLGRKGFVPEDLYHPVINIEYGVQYLSSNLKKFGGALPQTIASYNAGPDAVTRWLKARPNREWDEFIEEIPYKETNHYVKKVLKSYYIYSLLYPS